MGLIDRLVAIWRRDNPDEPLVDPRASAMSRRRFLGIVGSTAAAVALAPHVDLERLVWTPGQTIVVPDLATGLSFHRDAFCFVSTDMALADFQRQYNHAMSKSVELTALAPKAPFLVTDVQWPPRGPFRVVSDPVSGIAMRYVEQYHIAEQVTRYDLLVGFNGKAEG